MLLCVIIALKKNIFTRVCFPNFFHFSKRALKCTLSFNISTHICIQNIFLTTYLHMNCMILREHWSTYKNAIMNSNWPQRTGMNKTWLFWTMKTYYNIEISEAKLMNDRYYARFLDNFHFLSLNILDESVCWLYNSAIVFFLLNWKSKWIYTKIQGQYHEYREIV